MSLSPYSSRAALDKKQEGCLELFFFCGLLRALCRAPLKPLMHPVHLAWQSCETQDHRLGRQQLHLLIEPMFTLHLEDKRALTNVAHAPRFITHSGYTLCFYLWSYGFLFLFLGPSATLTNFGGWMIKHAIIRFTLSPSMILSVPPLKGCCFGKRFASPSTKRWGGPCVKPDLGWSDGQHMAGSAGCTSLS